MLITKFGKSEKLDYLVLYSRTFDFLNFKTGMGKESNVKI
jgi:hypothetical protein